MKPGIPWSIKGVEPELREVAKSAARRSGLTLGEWLNSAINEQADAPAESAAADTGFAETRKTSKTLISTHPIERAASKLENIAEQLARIAARETQGAYRPAAPIEERMDFAKVLGRVESNERQTVEAFSAVNDRLATISRQITRAQPAPKLEEQPSYQTLEKAVRNIVEHLEVSDKRTRENLKSLQERMGEMSSRVSNSNSEQLLKQAPAFNQLEQRLTDLAHRLDQPSAQQPLTDQLRQEIGQLASRIDTVRESSEALAARAQTQAVQQAQTELRIIEGRIVGLLNEAKQSISSNHVGPAEFQRFHHEIEKLNARIDDSSRHSASDRDVNALKVAVEQLSTRVAQGPDMKPLADLDRKVIEISQKLERAEAATRGLPQVSELERRFAELDQRLVQSLHNPSAQGGEEVVQKLMEVDERLTRTEHQLGHLETIERAITQLYDAIEQNRKATHDIAHDAVARVAEQFAGQQAGAPALLAGSPEIIALEIGLKAVREASDSADHRNQETLEAVHETLEQIVSKLAELETAAIGQRVAQAAAPAMGGFGNAALVARPAVEVDAFTQAAQNLAASTAVPMPQHEDQFAAEPQPQFAETEMDLSEHDEVSQAEPVWNEAGLAAAAPAMADENGIGDIVAAARRLHQASQGQNNVLSGVVPGSKSGKAGRAKASGFSLPFLDKLIAKPGVAKSGAGAVPNPANSNDGSKRKLVLVGILLLAIASFGVSNIMGRNHKAPSPAAQPAVEQQIAPEKATDAAPQPAQGALATPDANQPAPAQLVQPDAKSKDPGSSQQGDAGTVLPEADPILTGALPAAVAPQNMAASLTPSAVPTATEALDPAVGPAKLRQAAQTGDALAAFVVASHFLNGDTVGVDYVKAAAWYGRAANAGLAPAQYRLATLFERGKGVNRDLATALSWYERAGALGNVKAMHNAAVLAAGSELGKPDYAKAYKWFTLAATHGLKDSQFNLAVLIERGLGTKQDTGEALFWYMAAASQDDADSKLRVEALSKTLSAATVDAAKARLKSWTAEKAPEAANTVAANDAQWNPTTGAAATAPTNIYDRVKTLLTKLGYRVGELDGNLDLRTANAIKLFQIKEGLKVTGLVSPDLINTLASKAS